ncbi:amino acid ABC transporter ATP-binding protein [Amycolatopsis jejuensis]|uniref:amino acid ABC transporter ATP-binding protein n=1 Tax=Amycolatopsis jejuensis TaxID=330084 RepID=UPI000525D720|nr:amino acid ABC transporter ATP-binding protein [Amycolatopsis jejuensis]
MNEPTAMVDLRGIHKRFGRTTALNGVSLAVPAGSVVCIIGPSGSGKTTALRCINCLEKPDSGLIYVDGHLVGSVRSRRGLIEANEREIARQRRGTAMVFQHFNLFAHYTTLENLIAGPRFVQGIPRAAATATAERLLEQFGLADKRNSYPAELSGGQRQRVAIARALALDPQVILFDEPTSALDPELIGEVLEAMELVAAQGKTMIVVTHEIGFARKLAHEVVFMDRGEIVESGPPGEILTNPQSARLGEFLDQILA